MKATMSKTPKAIAEAINPTPELVSNEMKIPDKPVITSPIAAKPGNTKNSFGRFCIIINFVPNVETSDDGVATAEPSFAESIGSKFLAYQFAYF